MNPPSSETVVLLDGGTETYPRMLRAIEAARVSVHLEVYAFSTVGVGQLFLAALGAAAARGVKVVVSVDGWGSARFGLSLVAALRRMGCTATVHHRLFALLLGKLGRNHRKILLVDDEVAILGGINIGDENLSCNGHSSWADVAVLLHGPQCLHLGQWLRAGLAEGPKKRALRSLLQVGPLRIYLSALGRGYQLRRRYMLAVHQAEKRISLAHGYFLPDAGMVRALVAARARGVEVVLLLAGRSDIPLARAATRSVYRRLLPAGVIIYEWSASVLHAKVGVFDGELLLVGSFNLDPLSMTNMEVLVEAEVGEVAQAGEAWIANHVARAQRVTAIQASGTYWRWVGDPLGRASIGLVNAFAWLLKTPVPAPLTPLSLARLLSLMLATVVGATALVQLCGLPVLGSTAVGTTVLVVEFFWFRANEQRG